MNYFRCTVGGSGKGNTVTVTCAEEFAGLTITLSKTGKTYTKTCPSTSPYTVTFYGVENGTYTVSTEYDGQTYSETVVVQDISCVLNYGFTWKTWVDTASQLDSSDYDSLDEVLADEKALRELFLEHACVDYMVSVAVSNAVLETIINNDLCAKWINLSDYALDYLYANEVIADLMDEADKYGYGEWALMPQVPTMTSNTAPIGTASAKSVYESGYPAWKAFDNDASTAWASGSDSATVQQQWLRYEFPTAVKCVKATMRINGTTAETFKIQATNDTSSWTDISSVITLNNENYTLDVPLTASTEYKYYQVLILTHRSGNDRVYNISTLQFYAWAPKGNVPVMTSNTAPYGTASGTSNASGYDIYKACDGDDSTYYESASTIAVGSEGYLQYKFTNPVLAKKAKVIYLNNAGESQSVTVNIYGSNDGSTWSNSLGSQTKTVASSTSEIFEVDLTNDDYYLYYKVTISGNGAKVRVRTLQFYGRELKVSVPTMTSDTAPYGVARCTDEEYTTTQAYKAFNGNDSDYMADSATDILPLYLYYKFTTQTIVKMARVKSQRMLTGAIVALNADAINWTELKSITGSSSVTDVIYEIDNSAPYDTYGIKVNTTSASSGSSSILCYTLQFYGLDYSEKEFEEGATKKWLYDHGVELEELTSGGSGTHTKQEDSLYIGVSATTSITSFFLAALDLTDYVLFRAKVGEVFKGANHKIAVYSTLPTTPITSIAESVSSDGGSNLPNNISLDISSINQSYYVGIETQNGTSGAVAKYVEFTELWLE